MIESEATETECLHSVEFIEISSGAKRANKLVDRCFEGVSKSWHNHSSDFYFRDLQSHLVQKVDVEELPSEDLDLLARLDRCVRSILHRRGLDPLLEERAAIDARDSTYLILAHDLQDLLAEGRSLRSTEPEAYLRWMSRPAGASNYEALRGPMTPNAFVKFFDDEVSTDRAQQRRYALMLLAALERQAWFLDPEGERLEPIAEEISGLRRSFFTMFHCPDPVVKRVALKKLINILDITPIDADSAEGLISLQIKIRDELQSEDRGREHQLLLFKAFARSIENMLVLAAANKVGLFTEATRDGVWDSASALRDRFQPVSEHDTDGLLGRRYAYRFWTDYAEQAAQHITTNVTEAERWVKRIAKLSLRAFDIAKTVAAFSNPVTAIQGISLALETIEKTVNTIREVSYHVQWREEWFRSALELDRLARIFFCDPVAFDRVTQRVQSLKLGQYHANLFYSVMETLESVILQAPVDQVKQEALKLVIQYLTVEAPLIQCRGLLILVDLVEEGGTLGKTAHVLLRLLQASRWVRSEEGRSILDDYCELDRVPWLRSLSNDDDEVDIYLDVVKFLLVRVAEIKEEQEYGGHSLGTFVGLLSSSAEDLVIPRLLHVLKDFAIQLGREELYSAPDLDGNTPYHIAAQRQNIQMIGLIHSIFQPDINAQEYREGNAALHIAAKLGHTTVIQKLLRLGANSELINYDGYAPIHLAALNEDVEALEKLLEGGADVDRIAHDGRTALNIAIEADNVELVSRLVEEEAHIAEHYHACTPLVTAARGAQVNVLGYLIERKVERGQLLSPMEAVRILSYICADGRNVTCPEDFARFHLRMIEDSPRYAHAFDEFDGRLPKPVLEDGRIRIERPPRNANKYGNSPLLEAAIDPERHSELKELLAQGATDEPNFLGVTALHAAAATGNLAAIPFLLAAASDLEAKTEWGFTPLMLAAFYRQEEVLQVLLEAGADVEATNDYGDTALLVAAGIPDERGPDIFACLPRGAYVRTQMDDALSILKDLEKAGASVDAVDRLGNSALHHAVSDGDAELAAYLVTSRRSLFWAKDVRGYTALMCAVKADRSDVSVALVEAAAAGSLSKLHEEMLVDNEGKTPLGQMLAAAGLQELFLELVQEVPEARYLTANTPMREMPLHLAAYEGRLNILQLYAEQGWDLDTTDRFGNSSLHIATFGGQAACLEFLKRQECLSCASNHDLRNPLHVAASKGRLDILELFLDDVKNVLRRDGHGDLPLHIACRHGHLGCVERLLEVYPATVDWRNDDGETPLFIASCRGHVEVARLLQTHHVNPELANITGMTPLLAAAQEGKIKMVDFLVEELLADLKAADDEGETALHKAVFRINKEIVHKLLAEDSPLLYPTEQRLIHMRDLRQATPLHELAKPKLGFDVERALEILYTLLRADASITAADEAGNNFVHRLCYYGQWRLLSETEFYCKAVLKKSIDVTLRNKAGDTYLHQAVRGGEKPMVRACMEANLVWPEGVDVNAQNNAGITAPMLAAQLSQWRLLNYFACANGVNWALQDNHGRNILHTILANPTLNDEAIHCLKLILERRTSLLLIRDKSGRSPLHWAAEHGYSNACQLLLQHLDYARRRDALRFLRAKDDSGRDAEQVARDAGHHSFAALLQRYLPPAEEREKKCVIM